jgi:hypothetical protein
MLLLYHRKEAKKELRYQAVVLFVLNVARFAKQLKDADCMYCSVKQDKQNR